MTDCSPLPLGEGLGVREHSPQFMYCNPTASGGVHGPQIASLVIARRADPLSRGGPTRRSLPSQCDCILDILGS